MVLQGTGIYDNVRVGDAGNRVAGQARVARFFVSARLFRPKVQRVSNESLLVGDRALGAASAPRRKFNLTADPQSNGRNGY
jgi:hypothetical protein